MKWLWQIGAVVPALAFGAGAQAQIKPILEVRARYEAVDQAGLAREATAKTIRTRLGLETGAVHGLKALIEVEDVLVAGSTRFNVAVPGPGGASLNGRTAYPAVNDPAGFELNRLQLAWTPSAAFGAVAGRQRLLLDDQRFIGNSGWRQDEQTFDAVRLDLGPGPFKLTYAYVDRVNRVFAEKRDWRSNSHLVNASWAATKDIKLTGFVYALDFANSAVNSSLTSGARLTGKGAAGPFKLTYNAAAARQSDWADNPADFALGYYEADLAAAYGAWSLKAGYEQLGGNGVIGFTTPLGTNHGFNGWADAFAVAGGSKSHVDGLRDASLGLTAQPKFKTAYWSNTVATLVFHDFDAERTGADLGIEWDAQLQGAITPRLTLLFKYADFKREPTTPAGTTLAPPDRRKAWVSLEYRL